MELHIYDEAMRRLGIVDEIMSLIWTRRYWRCGAFHLLVPMTPRHATLFQLGRRIARRACDEVGEITYVHITRDVNGLEQIEARGKFLTHWLGKRLLLSQFVMSGSTDAVLRALVRQTLVAPADARRRVAALSIEETPLPGVASLNISADAYENVLGVCENRARLAKLGFKITTDLRTGQHTFRVYKGIDRTSAQGQHAICIFSPDFDNVLAQEFTRSNENVATAIYVGGAAPQEGEAKTVEEVDDGQSTGLYRVEFYYDASSLTRSYTENGQQVTLPEARYRELLHTRGLQTLEQKTESLSFSSVIDLHAGLRYRRDFDVGDRVTCLNQRWRIRIDARVTEIVGTYENGSERLDATFGVSIPSLREMLKWR